MLKDIVAANIIGLYFLYGLSFFTMGLAIAVQYRSYSTFRLAYSLSLLAAFGILYGFGEWGSVFVPLQLPDLGTNSWWKLVALQQLLEAIAYFFLFYFGAKLVRDTKPGKDWLLWLPLSCFGFWLVLFGNFVNFISTPQLLLWLEFSKTWSRYLLALPGGLLAAHALYLQVQEIRELNNTSVTWSLYLGSAFFVGYALLNVATVPPNPSMALGLSNGTSFRQTVNLAVEVLRTVTGFGLAFFITRILAAFDMEKEKRLAESRKQQTILLERDRISKDLHDGVLQSIYGVGLTLQTCTHLVGNDNEAALHQLKFSLVKLNEAVENIRSYINGLMPEHLQIGLEQLVHRLVDEYRSAYGLQVELRYQDSARSSPELSPEEVSDLYLILREALSNVVRHSGAASARVAITVGEEDLILAVKDNGHGFDSHGSGDLHGHGLKNMTDRTARLGGQINILSRSGMGTEIIVRVPHPDRRGSRPGLGYSG